ncbi:MAG: benzoylsuccinyl-CoA thiolase [Gammaproteobacteria bacterium]|nr:benzoylsuccinyl-CoA thiolase [Gammaproteobacteria bacterium]
MSESVAPAVAGLFVADEHGVRVLGAKCEACGTPYFPSVPVCHNPACPGSRMQPCGFGGRGVVWSYSIANFAPPPPHKYDQPFRPYAIAVVDLASGLRLVGQMVDPPEAVTVGAAVELVIDTLYHEQGKAFTTWKFKLV